MLILTRRVGESLMIGDSMEIKVMDVRGGQVRIGVGAPREIPVHRKEIYEKLNESNLVRGK